MSKRAIPQTPAFFIPVLTRAETGGKEFYQSAELKISDYLLERFIDRGYMRRTLSKLTPGRGRKATVYSVTGKGRSYWKRYMQRVRARAARTETTETDTDVENDDVKAAA